MTEFCVQLAPLISSLAPEAKNFSQTLATAKNRISIYSPSDHQLKEYALRAIQKDLIAYAKAKKKEYDYKIKLREDYYPDYIDIFLEEAAKKYGKSLEEARKTYKTVKSDKINYFQRSEEFEKDLVLISWKTSKSIDDKTLEALMKKNPQKAQQKYNKLEALKADAKRQSERTAQDLLKFFRTQDESYNLEPPTFSSAIKAETRSSPGDAIMYHIAHGTIIDKSLYFFERKIFNDIDQIMYEVSNGSAHVGDWKGEDDDVKSMVMRLIGY